MDIARTSQLNTVLEPLLAKSNSPFVFEGRHHDRPIGGFSDWKDKLDAAIGKDVAPWSLHDLRRTGVSLMQRLGIAFEIREACQNHKIKGIAGTYSRHDYDDEKRHAFEDLAAEIERIVADRKDRNGATVGG
jgi:integrase